MGRLIFILAMLTTAAAIIGLGVALLGMMDFAAHDDPDAPLDPRVDASFKR